MKFLKTAAALSVLPLLAACASNWDVDGAKWQQMTAVHSKKKCKANTHV